MSTLYTMTMNIEELVSYIDQRLSLSDFASADASLNGLQVGRPHKEVTKLVCAVDASLATFEETVRQKADALFVHHGLFWGKSIPITQLHYHRIALLIEHDIALIAAHLPLDAHPELGNNATIAQMLDLKEREPFGMYHGHFIGYRGRLSTPLRSDEIASRLGFSVEQGLKILPFGKDLIETIGIVSGGAAHEVQEAISLGLDAYLTGEASHTMYPFCEESNITMICGGHYATEIFGVQQVAKDIAQNCAIQTSFIALPTSL